ncbi:MAG: L-histidine N(alpha)-methyltransferase [Limisphaerales bacterium]
MDWTSHVAVHESALPQVTRQRIVEALRRGELDSSLLYVGLGQTLRWVDLHHAIAPARHPEVTALYDGAFRRAAELCRGNVVHVVSLACGDGTKDTQCLQLVRESGRTVIYTPTDVSLEMVLTAEQTATSALRGLQTTPLLCELARCSVLPALLKSFDPSGAERLVLFLGTIHNFWPPDILRSVIYPVRSQDHLLIGANLAPSENYDSALNRILTQYDNAPTHGWLMGALSELNLNSNDGALAFSIVPSESITMLKRIQVDFIFTREREINFFNKKITFAKNDKLRVFYSYRFTVDHLREFLAQSRLSITQEWVAPNEEEGLFLCRRST